VIVPIACSIICLAQSLHMNQKDDGGPLGLVYNHLSFQHIASGTFHSQTKERLAGMIHKPGSKARVGLIGVEYGSEVGQLNDLGFDVVGFEADPTTYVDHLKGYEARGHAQFVYCGVSDTIADDIALEYQGKPFNTCLTTLDAKLDEHLAILSVDIQGMEPQALQGSKGLIQKHGVDMLWVEVQPHTCHDVLNFMFENEYVIFDTEWWGHPKEFGDENPTAAIPVASWYGSEAEGSGKKKKASPSNNFQRLILNKNTTQGVGTDIRTYCEAIQSESYRWLWVQTDIVGIHKNAYKTEYWEKLATMGA